MNVLSFPPFRLDLVEERLWNGERELRLRRKPFAILCHLARRPGRLVTHSEIVEAVWGNIAMSESLLRTHVHDLRRVLGVALIETVVGRGYRFVAEMGDAGGAATASLSTEATVVVIEYSARAPRRLLH
jgi:DNA-binding response OmpR family regulator